MDVQAGLCLCSSHPTVRFSRHKAHMQVPVKIQWKLFTTTFLKQQKFFNTSIVLAQMSKFSLESIHYNRNSVFITSNYLRTNSVVLRRVDCTRQKYLSQVKIIRIYLECEYGIEKSVPRINDWHHKACRVMTIDDHEGQIFLSYSQTNYGLFFLYTIKYCIFIF